MIDQDPTSETTPSRSWPPFVVIAVVALIFLGLLTAASFIGALREKPAAEKWIAQMEATVPTAEAPNEVQALLAPLEGATSVSHDPGAYGSYHVAYLLTESYPADNAIQQISSRLDALGWTPLADDWLNPGNPSSHVDGWSEFRDASRTPHRHVHGWGAQ